ncbi:MAG: DUF6293 family protein [archaeon]
MEEVVHIIPLGYEFDRVVKPFQGEGGFRPNRVYLLSTIPPVKASKEVLDKHDKYTQKVKKELEKLNIKVILKPTNLIDILELIQKISKIVFDEKSKGNHLYINMSGAGRLTSVASTLSGMVHDVKVYYVNSNGYADEDPRMDDHGYTIIEDSPKIKWLENFQINIPDKLQLKALVKIWKDEHVRTIDLIECLGNEGFEDFSVDYYTLDRSEKSAVIMRLNRNVIDKLTKKGYINKKKIGRENEYKITETGKYIVSISGFI